MAIKLPYLVNFALTTKCNLNCIHCSSVNYRNVGNELSTPEIFKIIDELNTLGVFKLFFDGGENLLRADFFDICEYASGSGIDVSLSTNGMLMDESKAERLKKIGVRDVQISLDGATPETHDSFRGKKGSFSNAINCINILNKNKINTTVACTISRYNNVEVDEMIQLCISHGIKNLIFSRLIHAGNAIKNSNIFLNRDELNSIFLHLLQKKIEIADKLNLIFIHNPVLIPYVKKMKFNSKIKKELIQSLSCGAGKRICWITSTGDLTPCPVIPITLGNIRKTPFEKIWKENEVLNQLRNCTQYINQDCARCRSFALCEGGCHADAYGVTNNLFLKDPMCPR
jgi:radical SAM protein with 4Fe4S-binding SPASM domain